MMWRGVEEGGREEEEQHGWTWRTFSPADSRHSGLHPSLWRSAPLPPVLVLRSLSGLLACSGHPR